MLSAADGEQALALAEREEIGLLFSDVVMPGIELARAARDKYPDLPILLASGYSEEIIGGGAGGFDVLRKPYGAESLGKAIAALFPAEARD